MARLNRTLIPFGLAIAALSGACGDAAAAYTGGDAGDTDADSDTDTDADADADTDTGEDETPPELPALCSADGADANASGEGDGRSPGIERGDTSLVAWSYDPQDEGVPEAWRLELAAYDPEVPGVTASEPFAASSVVIYPQVAANGAAFGVVWLDSRWDAACDPEDPESCSVDVAFAAFDGAGVPTAEEPVRITTSGRVARSRPGIAPGGDGWLLAWAEYDETEALRLYAQPADGATPAEAFSGDEIVTGSNADVALASTGELAVAVWLPSGNGIAATPLGLADGAPAGDTGIWDDGVTVQAPRIAASADGFVVTWTRRAVEDFEAYALLLDATGAPAGEMNRLTWTISDVRDPVPAWSGAGFAVAWLSNRANGDESCADPDCEDQIFASILDADGALAAVPVQLSDSPNPSSAADIAWDGSGWTALWELRRELRQEVHLGRIVCE